ncbi:acyl-CoA desaturase [Pseudonocardia sp. MH-G8]|uniref:fatty acid desaturase family protein n=1 Tax=Pseudonocardia sp. MH-G8 TaxID=1854588 RepID=UPI000BA145B0|nr:acyl-CoA desaturase [Pseudonocardia sp. MH-G8]OZM81813.1 acyl-CoA desaturase [Pseudonocardia sp. MH-G8]
MPDTPSAAAHLTDEQVEAIGAELDAIRAEVVDSLGEADARYIHRVIAVQRALEVGGRGMLIFSKFPPAWIAGTAALSVAKILDNMEIGHNVLHGQWDWMRDPKVHSTTWEWDHATPAEAWKRTHNYEHHTFTNIRGKDRDLGYTIMRITPEQEWKPSNLFQPLTNLGLSLIFEWGIALYDLEFDKVKDGTKTQAEARADLMTFWRKSRKQFAKDFVLFPLLSGPGFLQTAAANLTANVVRNVWSHAVIFCGHFPDGTETFEEERLEGETKGQWYIRQMLGSANLSGSPLFHIMTGNLSHQIEHHLFPDVPSNRYAEIAPKVREICRRYGLPYTTGSLPRQYGKVLRKIARLAFPGGGPKNEVTPLPARPKPVGTPIRLAG